MAELKIQKEDGGKKARHLLAREWEPLRAMRELLRWDPFAEIVPTPVGEMAFAPSFEVKETGDAFVFKADVPGVQDKDIEVKITSNRLCISGKREQEKTDKGDTYYTYERSYGSFMRTFTLPEGVAVDQIKADLKSGVLTLTLPKKPEVKPKTIPVKGS